jgi:predicted MPP superfamily phosphohydrolase
MRSPELTAAETEALAALEPRIGRVHLRQRLGIEHDHEHHVFRKGMHVFHIENWYSVHGLIRRALWLAGLHARGRRNALAIGVRRHEVALADLPKEFDGFTLLQLSDLHVDMNAEFMDVLIERVRPLEYDLCVLTGDYRARTFGSIHSTLDGLRRLKAHLNGETYAVLGNHDSIRMVPPMEAMGYRLLLNESTKIERGGAALYLAGIDDAHYFGTDNLHRAAHDIPPEAFSILLSHTPEAYRQAAHADFSMMLSGHTHGGQICLPGGVPVITDSGSPRRFSRGPWRYHRMVGFTSVGAGSSIVDVRLNCPPEIVLHRLRRSEAA